MTQYVYDSDTDKRVLSWCQLCLHQWYRRFSFGAVNDDEFGTMTTLGFQWSWRSFSNPYIEKWPFWYIRTQLQQTHPKTGVKWSLSAKPIEQLFISTFTDIFGVNKGVIFFYIMSFTSCWLRHLIIWLSDNLQHNPWRNCIIYISVRINFRIKSLSNYDLSFVATCTWYLKHIQPTFEMFNISNSCI